MAVRILSSWPTKWYSNGCPHLFTLEWYIHTICERFGWNTVDGSSGWIYAVFTRSLCLSARTRGQLDVVLQIGNESKFEDDFDVRILMLMFFFALAELCVSASSPLYVAQSSRGCKPQYVLQLYHPKEPDRDLCRNAGRTTNRLHIGPFGSIVGLCSSG